MDLRAAILCLASCLISSAAAAQTAPSTESVIDLRASGGFDADLAAELRLALGTPIELTGPPDALIRGIQWLRPDPLRDDCEAQAARVLEVLPPEAGAAPSVERFAALVDLAAQKNLFLDVGGAEDALERARYYVPCLDEPLQSGVLARFLLQEALARTYGDGAAEPRLYDNVVALNPDAYLDQSLAPPIRRSLEEAAERAQGVEAVSLSSDLGPLHLDGSPPGESFQVRPGRHLLQIRGPGGDMRSRWVAVGQGLESTQASNLTAFNLPLEGDVKRELARDLLSGELSPERGALITAWLGEAGLPRQGFVLSAADTWALRMVQAEGEVSAIQLRDSRPRTARPTPERKLRFSGTGGITFLWLSSTRTATIDTGTDPDADADTAIGVTTVPRPARLGYSAEGDLQLGPVQLALRGTIAPHVRNQDGVACADLSPTPMLSLDEAHDHLGCLPDRPTAGLGLGVGLPLRPTARWVIVPAAFFDAWWIPQLVVPMESIGNGRTAIMEAIMVGPQGQLSAHRLIPLPGVQLSLGGEVRAGRLAVGVENEYPEEQGGGLESVTAVLFPWSLAIQVGVER